MLLSLPLLISHLFYARAACMRMWALLARGRCEVSGAHLAHGALWSLVIMLVACTMIILYMLNMLWFNCCPDWAATWHLFVYNSHKTHIIMCVKYSFYISRYIQMHVEQSYCECFDFCSGW